MDRRPADEGQGRAGCRLPRAWRWPWTGSPRPYAFGPAGSSIVDAFLAALADRHPELAPVLDRLRDEHERIAALTEELRRVVGERHPDPARVLPEVVRLTEELEAHLTYEEERLIPILDAATAR